MYLKMQGSFIILTPYIIFITNSSKMKNKKPLYFLEKMPEKHFFNFFALFLYYINLTLATVIWREPYNTKSRT